MIIVGNRLSGALKPDPEPRTPTSNQLYQSLLNRKENRKTKKEENKNALSISAL
jgi:hypothetical protein